MGEPFTVQLSDEQQLFIEKALQGYNILVDACIGSGKTTAIQNLCKIDAIGLKIMVIIAIIIAFASAVTFIDGRMAGYALVGTIFALAVLRFILFCSMNRKEN